MDFEVKLLLVVFALVVGYPTAIFLGVLMAWAEIKSYD